MKQKTNKKEVRIMKKMIMVLFFAALSVVLFYGSADAISGVCSECHTMHNSQDGTEVDSDGPNGYLTKGSCSGCHIGASSIGPRVDEPLAVDMLAGGSFAIAAGSAMNLRHDVKEIYAGGDTTAGYTTPGKTGAELTVSPIQLTCAGYKGCHGNHVGTNDSDAGILGSHHGAATLTYRFLWLGTATNPTAVLGKGDPDFEPVSGTGSVSNSKHNVYSASATQGISLLCDQCHDEFHGETAGETGGTVTPWKRHPTDLLLFSGTEGPNWASTDVTISAGDAPIGLLAIGGGVLTTTDYYSSGSRDAANSAVICLSCHRAHGSQYPDLLRWDINSTAGALSQEAGESGTTGCLSCHHDKNGV